MKTDLRIEVVASTQRGLMSPLSQKSRETVRAVLSTRYTDVSITIVNDLADLEALVRRAPDLVFLGMKLVLSDQSLGLKDPAKIWIAQYLDEHDIAYTGSGQLAQELEIDKVLAKRRVADTGLATPSFHMVDKTQWQTVGDVDLIFPVFIKPTNRGGGLGIDSESVAKDYRELQSKVKSLATELRADSLIETYLPGREFSVAILQDEASAGFSVMPIEIIAPPDEHGARLLSAAVKIADTEQCIAVDEEGIRREVCDLAINVFHALGARDYGRIDIRMDEAGTPHFLEANLMPSLKNSTGNYFPKACVLNQDLAYEQMILHITRLGLTRRQLPIADTDILEVFSSLEPAY